MSAWDDGGKCRHRRANFRLCCVIEEAAQLGFDPVWHCNCQTSINTRLPLKALNWEEQGSTRVGENPVYVAELLRLTTE